MELYMNKNQNEVFKLNESMISLDELIPYDKMKTIEDKRLNHLIQKYAGDTLSYYLGENMDIKNVFLSPVYFQYPVFYYYENGILLKIRIQYNAESNNSLFYITQMNLLEKRLLEHLYVDGKIAQMSDHLPSKLALDLFLINIRSIKKRDAIPYQLKLFIERAFYDNYFNVITIPFDLFPLIKDIYKSSISLYFHECSIRGVIALYRPSIFSNTVFKAYSNEIEALSKCTDVSFSKSGVYLERYSQNQIIAIQKTIYGYEFIVKLDVPYKRKTTRVLLNTNF